MVAAGVGICNEKQEAFFLTRYRRTVRAGALVEVVTYNRPEPSDTPRQRHEKQKLSSLARKKLNAKQSNKQFEYVAAANFTGQDYMVTLSFDNAHLPPDRRGVVSAFQRFIRKLRAERKRRGQEVKFIRVIENKHGEGRFHIHMLLNATGGNDFEEIRSLWEFGTDIDIQYLNKYGDDARFAAGIVYYLTKERHTATAGVRRWSGSRNLVRPEITGEWVHDNASIIPPVGAEIIASEEIRNEWGRFEYCKYALKPQRQRTRTKRTSRTDREYRDTGGSVRL